MNIDNDTFRFCYEHGIALEDIHDVMIETQDSALMCVRETFTRDGERRTFLRHIDNPIGGVMRARVRRVS